MGCSWAPLSLFEQPQQSTLYFSFVWWCGVRLHRKVAGSRSAPLLLCMSILARTQHLSPSSLPFCISFHSRRFSSIVAVRYGESFFAIRPACTG